MSKYCIALLVGLSLASSAHALQRSWAGPATGGLWSTDANWNPVGKPVAGDRVFFNGAVNSTADLVNVAITQIAFLSTNAGCVINGAVTLDASVETVNVDLFTNSVADATINAVIAFSNATMFIRNSSTASRLSFKGVLSTTGVIGVGLRIYGPGRVEFSGSNSNTYTSTTAVATADGIGGTGRLLLSPLVNNANLVPGDLSIFSGASVTMSFGNGIADTCKVNIDTGGTFDLNGSAEIIGQLTGTGAVSLGPVLSPLVILTVGDGNDFTFGGMIGGFGTLIKTGAGTMTLAGKNNFFGPTKVLGGTLNLQSPAGSVAIPGDLTLVDAGSNSAVKWLASNQVVDTATVTVGALTSIDLNGFNETILSLSETSSTVNLAGGELTVTGELSMVNGGIINGLAGLARLTLGGNVNVSFPSQASARIDCPVLLNATCVFTVPAFGASSLTIGGVISGAGGLTKAGNGSMRLAPPSANLYTGTTTVEQGFLFLVSGQAISGPIVIGNNVDPANSAVLQDGKDNAIAPTSSVLVNSSGLFSVNGFNEHIGPLSGTGPVSISEAGQGQSGVNELTINVASGTAIYDGIISAENADDSVRKTGAGTLMFTQNNTYPGPTIIDSGTLVVNGSQTGGVTVTGTLSGTGTVGNTGVASGGTLRPGGSGGGQLSCANLNFNPGSFLDVNLTAGGFGRVKATGLVIVNASLRLLPEVGFTAAAGTKFRILDNIPDGPIFAAFVNAAEGATLTAGTQQLQLSYVGGTGNDIELAAPTVVVPPNVPPVVTSDPAASPNPASAGQTVTLTVAAADVDNDPLTFDWSFGDGTFGSGASTSHIYAMPGVFNATVVVTDSQGQTVIKGTQVTVNNPLVGDGIDKDGDGFSNTFETAAGSDPLITASTPTGAPIALQPLVVSKLGINLNFAKLNLDGITLGGTVTVPTSFAPMGKIVVFDVGGVTQAFTLSSKGKGLIGKNSCSFGVKAGKQKYSLKLSKGSFAAAFADEGLTSKNDNGSPHSIKCSLSFNGGIFQLAKTVTYKAKEKKSGAAKGVK